VVTGLFIWRCLALRKLECSQFGVKISVYRLDDESAEGKFVCRFSGEPCYVEKDKEAKKLMGLIVSDDIMKAKILSKSGEDVGFNVSILVSKD
jgi:hypothetical protein